MSIKNLSIGTHTFKFCYSICVLLIQSNSVNSKFFKLKSSILRVFHGPLEFHIIVSYFFDGPFNQFRVNQIRLSDCILKYPISFPFIFIFLRNKCKMLYNISFVQLCKANSQSLPTQSHAIWTGLY